MRDIRYGARSTVSLDRGQLIGLGFFAVLSGGLMFALGYGAGKNRRPVEAPVASTLGRVDQNHEHQQKLGQVDFTFYESLLEKTPRQKMQDLVPEATKPEPAKVEVAKAPEKLAEPMKFNDALSIKLDEPLKVEPPKEPLKEALAKIDSAEAQAELADPAPALVPPLVVARKAPPPTPTAMLTPESNPASGDYTIQVNAFRTEPEARDFTRKLKAKGFASEVVPAMVNGKGMWYRVRVGRFESEGAAKLYKQKLDREGFTPWVKRID